jgi:hypothetical protein
VDCRFLILFAATLSMTGPDSSAQPLLIPKTVSSQLEVTLYGQASEGWAVKRGELLENYFSDRVSIELENRSPIAMRSARFYAELFDQHGKLCSSLAFRLDYNAERTHDPLAPHKDRTLISGNLYLAPATRPVKTTLFLIDDEDVTGYVTTAEGMSRFYAPATVVTSPVHWDVLPDGLHRSTQSAMWDILLARLDIDRNGKVDQYRILNAADAQIAQWFEKAVHNLPFLPAGTAAVFRPSTVLILVRGFDPSNKQSIGANAFLARDSEWVSSYVANMTDATELPNVNELLFRYSGADDAVPEEHLTLISPGTFWSEDVYTRTSFYESASKCCRELWGSITK